MGKAMDCDDGERQAICTRTKGVGWSGPVQLGPGRRSNLRQAYQLDLGSPGVKDTYA
jgi:hypothetical protein